jgi:hypothetical protein
VCGQPIQDPVARLVAHPELEEELTVEVRVPEADHRAGQARGVKRRAQNLDHLGGSIGSRCADQLHPRLGELAHLPALRVHGPVRPRDVGEAEGRLLVLQPRGDKTRDRNRHVRAHRQQLATLVEEPVRRVRVSLVAPPEHLRVLDRRGGDLPVASLFEGSAKRRLERAQLAHLLGQHVARPRWGRVDHRHPPIIAFSPLTGCKVRPRRISTTTTGGDD